MSSTASVRVMSPEEIVALGSSDVPHLHLPERARHFPERQMRLLQLARGHAMGDFLQFMAALAQAQHQALEQMPAVPVPDLNALSQATRQGQAALSVQHWPRDSAWQQALRHIALTVQEAAPEASRPALLALAQATPEQLEEQADALLGLSASQLQLDTAALIGAALQVYWLHLSTSVQAQHAKLTPDSLFGRTDQAHLCPCCGSEPVASITRQQGAALSQRYLHCALCGAEWHLQRSRCSHCLDDKQLAYQSLDLADADPEDSASRVTKAAIQAEECGQCRHYLKIMHTDRDPFVEPVADDLATLTLDLLMADTGMTRHGHNLALIFHDGGGAGQDPDGAS